MNLQDLKNKIEEIEQELENKGFSLDMVLIQDTYFDDEKEIELDLIDHYGYLYARLDVKEK